MPALGRGLKRTYLNLWLNVVRRIGYTETGVFLRFIGYLLKYRHVVGNRGWPARLG